MSEDILESTLQEPRTLRKNPEQTEYWIRTLHDLADGKGMSRDDAAEIYNEVFRSSAGYCGTIIPEWEKTAPLGDLPNRSIDGDTFESRLESALFDYVELDDASAETVVSEYSLDEPPVYVVDL